MIWKCLGTTLGDIFWALTISWTQLLAHVWSSDPKSNELTRPSGSVYGQKYTTSMSLTTSWKYIFNVFVRSNLFVCHLISRRKEHCTHIRLSWSKKWSMYLHFEGIQVVYFNSTLQQHQYIQFILNCALLILETMSMLIKLVKKRKHVAQIHAMWMERPGMGLLNVWRLSYI